MERRETATFDVKPRNIMCEGKLRILTLKITMFDS
jgi:hypothetical protein